MNSKTAEQLDKIEQTIEEIQEMIRDMNTQVSEMVDLLTDVRNNDNK
jgi:methyl-accepting chemotaxis protein